MTTWTSTTAEDDIIKSLDGWQSSRYCFSRDWGCNHDEALVIALDDSGRLFTELMEKTFG